jgi:protein tyrosine phosphatase (PTP) superfamily phosphohydrolase (DUF442 family)
MQTQQMRQQAQDQGAVRSAFSSNIGPDGQVNRAGVLSALSQSAPLQAMEYQGKFAQMDAAQAEAKKKVLQDNLDKFSTAYRLASTAVDQPSYDQMKAQMQQMGLPVDHLPPQYDPQHMALLKSRSAMMTLDAKQGLDAITGMSQVNINEKKAPLERAKLVAETEKLQSEAGTRKVDFATNDPAKLVPGLVPKEKQEAVYKEIESAENTRRMADSIMSAFDQAVKDTRGLRPGAASYIKTPRSALALHQAMQPTFKDLEGTVRQAAMDNTFKNITPVGIDSAQDIATKRAALQAYLQSKISAPTARAYGIDLAKFESTAPYESAAPAKAPGRGNADLVPSAAAADVPTIRMRGPDGKVRSIPASMKGEAIAGGGTVVK